MKISPGDIARLHRTDRKRMGMLKEQYAEVRKEHLQYCCNQVWMKNGERFYGEILVSSKHSRCHLTDQVTVRSSGRKSPYLCERHIETTSVWSKSLARYIPRLCDVCGAEFGKETLWSQTLKNWRRWTHQVLTPMKGHNFKFPVANGTVKASGDQRLGTSTLIRDHPERGEEQEVLRGESDALSSPTPLQDDSTRDDAEGKNDFWSVTGDFICRHHVEPRVKLYVPKEESFPTPLKYIEVTRNTHTSLDVLLEKNIEDYWNVDGERIIRCMDMFHNIHFIERKAT